MCEHKNLSLEAHNQVLNTLKNWFKEVVSSMEEVEVTKNQERTGSQHKNQSIFACCTSQTLLSTWMPQVSSLQVFNLRILISNG